MRIKHQTEYDEAVNKAESDFRTNAGVDSFQCPYIFSSNMADAYWITLWCLYWNGAKPIALHKSVGYRWKIIDRSNRPATVTVEKADHRTGIMVQN